MNLIRSQEQQLINYKQLHEQSEKKLQMISGELTSSQRHGLAVEARLNATYLEINELKKRVRMMIMMMMMMMDTQPSILFTFCRQQRLDGTAYECGYEGYRSYQINCQFDSICYWETTHTEILPRLQGRDQDLQLVDLILSLRWCTRKSCIM